MRNTKNIYKNILKTLTILLATLTCFTGCSNNNNIESDNYINNSSDFVKALQNGNKRIYVDDISFDAKTEINLNYPVEIIGKNDKSTISNAHIIINATNVPSSTTDISFKNVIFDGGVSKNDIVLEDGKTFTEIVDDMSMYSCIDGSIGYYTINIDNCEIRNYINEEGPAIYINNDVNYRLGTKKLNITNSSFYNNISNLGTVKVFSDVLETNIDNCNFYSNLARAGQGISVGNGISNITNCIIHDNDFFRFVNPMERKYPSIFHDDKQTYKGVTTNALDRCCGALFIGGSHTKVDSCKIYNNKTIFGGGIGIINASSLEEDEKVEINNTIIQNNTAILSGAGIYLESNQGETTYFNNCKIISNTALENGSVIYSTTYSPDDESSYGGNVLFTFCTIANNTSNDENTFNFYDLLKPELAGNINLKGCFVIDNSSYTSTDNEYNYVANMEKAIQENVISKDDINNINEKDIKPKKNSAGDIVVQASEYKTWSNIYKNEDEKKAIGFSSLTTKSNNTFNYLLVIIPVAIILVLIGLIIIFRKEKKNHIETKNDDNNSLKNNKKINCNEYEFKDILEKVEKLYAGILTKKETEVATYLLYNYRRKEIASKLFVSDETIKSHISNIFKKTGTTSKEEFKQVTEEKLISQKL